MFQFILLVIALIDSMNCQDSLLTQLPLALQLGARSNGLVQQTTVITSESSIPTTISPSSANTLSQTNISSTASVPSPTPLPTPTPIPSVNQSVAAEAEISPISTADNKFVWSGGSRIMIGGCFDIQPPNGDNCQQQRDLGKCARKWMLEGGLCAKTCGFCDDECIDIQPTIEFTCAQEKERNQCDQIGNNFCRLTCGRCAGAVTIEELAKTPITPKAEAGFTPTPITTPSPTPALTPTMSTPTKTECSCEQCEQMSTQQILNVVEQAVKKVMEEFLR